MRCHLLILFLIFVVYDCKEDYHIHHVNITDGRSELSIVSFKFASGYLFKVVPGLKKISAVARAILIEQINSTGWGHLHVESSPEYSDELQAYMSGVIEGIISRTLIAAHWSNTYAGYCAKPSDYCKNLYKYFKDNFISIVKKSRNQSGFLKMVRLQLWQIKGLQDGYDGDWKRNSSEINESHLLSMEDQLFKLYLLQADCDLEELSKILGGSVYHYTFSQSVNVEDERCSALIKYVKGTIYSAHVTWSPYNDMLRLTKLYDFSYRVNADEKTSPFVAARKISFSGYPGQLSSLDDFYVTSAGLMTTETTINNYNLSLYEPLKNMASEIVLEYARADAANRLATSGPEWANIFSKNNSGTYCNQWMIVNYNLMQNHIYGERIPDGTLFIAEQLPGIVTSEDVTEHLRTSTYWASYNLPYNKTIWKIGDFQSEIDKYGDLYDYDKSPRALIFRRNVSSVVDGESMMRLMRYNDFKNDPLSRCNCSPPYNAAFAISSRADLNVKSGWYPFSGFGYQLHGGIDLKFTNMDYVSKMRFVGISGPTYDQQPAFDWTKVTGQTLSHNMQPLKFEFPPVLSPFP